MKRPSLIAICAMVATLGSPLRGEHRVLASVVDTIYNTVRVQYVGVDSHVHGLYLASGLWYDSDLTATVGGPSVAAGTSIANVVDTIYNTVRVQYIGVDSHVHGLYLSSGLWYDADLTVIAGGPSVAAGTSIANVVDTIYNTMRVDYIGVDSHVHELYISGGGVWYDSDLTATVGGPSVAAGTSIANVVDTIYNAVRVEYVGVDSHVHGLYLSSGLWYDADLTVIAGGPSVAAGTSIANVVDTIYHTMRVDYIGVDSHVHELYISGGGIWYDSDLTATVGGPPVISLSLAISGNLSLSGVTVNLTGTGPNGDPVSLSAQTDSAGNYSFFVAAGGTYTAVPFLSGYTFSPASWVFNGVTVNQTANSTASAQTGSLTQNCNDISGTWTDGNYTYALSESAGMVTGTDTLILPYGSVVWTVSGQTTDGSVYLMRNYNPNPTDTDFGTPDQEDDFTLTFPTCSSVTATLTNKIPGAGSSFLGGGNPSTVNQSTTWSRSSPPTTQPTTADVTVVAWVDASQITLPTPQTPALAGKLNTPGACTLELKDWAQNQRTDLNGQADTDYANAWLLIHSANGQPYNNPASELASGDFRLFNRFQIVSNGNIARPTVIPHGPPVVGWTPDPCGSGIKLPAQAHPNNGYVGIDSSSTGVAQLNEGRLGTTGRAINHTINGGTTPWIWSVIEFNSAGNIVIPIDHAMFPTYSIYLNGNLVLTCPQSSPSAFITQSESYQRLPSQIPVSSGLTSCHN
jgi:hypothetical protein